MLHAELKEKVQKLENVGLNWMEIANMLDVTYEEVRKVAEEDNQKQ